MLGNDPEQLTESFNILMTPSLKNRIKEYAEEKNVNMATAARYILHRFFETHFENSEIRRCHYEESEPMP